MRPLKFREPLFDLHDNFLRYHYWGYGVRLPDCDPNTFTAPYRPEQTGIKVGNSYQYTGILDKNGNEIYENDIVKKDGDWRNYKIIINYSGVHPWHEDALKSNLYTEPHVSINLLPLSVSKNTIIATDWEKIGDIHSNPELLTPASGE